MNVGSTSRFEAFGVYIMAAHLRACASWVFVIVTAQSTAAPCDLVLALNQAIVSGATKQFNETRFAPFGTRFGM